MGLSHVWLFLAHAAFFVLLGNAAGSHSLLYNMTVLSRDGFVQSRFFAEGYLDRQAFLHYDHKKGRAEPWGRWAEKLAAETWETETMDLNESWKELRKLLAEILSLQEEKGEPPAVNVTCSQDSEGMVHLTEKTLVHQRSRWIVSIPVAVVFIIGFCVYCYIKKRKTASATGRPEPISLQDLDQCQTEPTDHNGLTHPEFQSSCQTPAPSV